MTLIIASNIPGGQLLLRATVAVCVEIKVLFLQFKFEKNAGEELGSFFFNLWTKKCIRETEITICPVLTIDLPVCWKYVCVCGWVGFEGVIIIILKFS